MTQKSEFSTRTETWSYPVFSEEMFATPLLTHEEEIELAGRIKVGDEVARERLITANIRLVVRVAREFGGRGVEFADLVSAGCIGLIRMVERFDPAFGCKFSTYASLWIKESMRQEIARNSRTVRVPRSARARCVKVAQEIARLEAAGDEASISEIAAALNEPTQKVYSWLSASYANQSFDAPIETSEDGPAPSMVEAFEDAAAVSPFSAAASSGDFALVTRALELLSEKERCVVKLRMGFDGGGSEPLSLEECGKVFKLTRERIRQIQNAATRKLRKILAGWEPQFMAN